MVTEQARKLGEALVASKVMTSAQLDDALKVASQDSAPSLVIGLLEMGFLTFKVFEKFVAASLKIQSAIVASRKPVKEIVEALGIDLMKNHFIYPFGLRVDKGVKTLALGMVDPTDSTVIQVVESKTTCRVMPILISLPDFKNAMRENIQQQVDVKTAKEAFVLIRPGDVEDEVKTQGGLNQHTGTFAGSRTVQPKPGWDHGSLNVGVANGQKYAAVLMGSNDSKYREEVLAKLDLDPSDAKLLSEESYTRETLHEQLRKVKLSRLQKVYDSLGIEFKLEGLINALIKAGVVGKNDILISSAISLVFSEEPK